MVGNAMHDGQQEKGNQERAYHSLQTNPILKPNLKTHY